MRGSLCALLVCLCADAVAAERVCVVLLGPSLSEPDSYRRFVLGEIRRHQDYSPADSGCELTLHFEYLELDGAGFLTGYIPGQVPVRLPIADRGALAGHLAEVTAQLLRSTPRALEADIGRYLDESIRESATLATGTLLIGIEAMQTVGFAGSDAFFLPGIAIRVRQELGYVTVGARAAASLFPVSGKESRPRMTLVGVVEPEVAWFPAPEATSAFYLAGSLGAHVVRFEGPDAQGFEDTLTDWGVGLGARVGVELLRQTAHRVDLFAMAHIPFFVTAEDDSTLLDAYTPSVHAGVGVAF